MGLGLEESKSGDECFQFGIISGCHPYCPVFERGECEQQKENEIIFDEQSRKG